MSKVEILEATRTAPNSRGRTRGEAIRVLLVTFYTSFFSVFSQIKIRYSIKYSDALSVRLFYTVPSVIIYEFLLIIRVLPIFDEPPCDNNKRSRNLPDQSLVSCFPLHHMGFPICKQYYDNLIC